MSRGPKVTLELRRISAADDEMGGENWRWYGIRNIKGTLLGLSADERLGPDKVTVYVTHMFFCDDPGGLTITEKNQFRWGIREFDIQFVNRIAERKNKHLEIGLLEVT